MLLISKSPLIAKVAYESLGLELDIGSLFFSILVVQDGKIQAILVWHDHQKRHNAWWTIVSFDKRWCTKKVLKYFFFLAFDYFGLNHINAMTRVSNTHANRFLTRLGFQKQGRLKNAYLTLDASSDATPTPDAPSHPEQGAVADVPSDATPTLATPTLGDASVTPSDATPDAPSRSLFPEPTLATPTPDAPSVTPSDAPSVTPSDATPDAPSRSLFPEPTLATPTLGDASVTPSDATPTPDAPSHPEQGAVRLFEDAFLWQKMSSKNLITGF